MKNYFNVLAIHGEISFNKKCFTSGETEKTAEFYSAAGFKEFEIIIQEFKNSKWIKETNFEFWGVEIISVGQLISEVDVCLECAQEAGTFGEENGVKKN